MSRKAFSVESARPKNISMLDMINLEADKSRINVEVTLVTEEDIGTKP